MLPETAVIIYSKVYSRDATEKKGKINENRNYF